MGINVEHSVPASISGEANYASSGARIEEEMRRQIAQELMRDRQFAEGQRQFDAGQANTDEDQEFRRAIAALEARQRDRQMGQQAYQFDAGQALQYDQLDQQAYNQDRAYDINEQELDQRAQASENQLQGQQATQLAQIAEQRQKQKFEMFMADREAIMEGNLTPAQFRSAQAQLEQRYGMGWGMPEEVAAQQQGQAAEMQLQQMGEMFSDPINQGQSLATPGELQWMSQNVPPEKVPEIAQRRRAEALAREELRFKQTEDAREDQAFMANQERDDALTAQKTQASARQAQQTLEQKAQQHEQKMAFDKQKAKLAGEEKYRKAHAEWKLLGSDPESGRGEEPKREWFVPEDEAEESSGFAAFYAKLEPGQKYRHPDGTTRTKGGR